MELYSMPENKNKTDDTVDIVTLESSIVASKCYNYILHSGEKEKWEMISLRFMKSIWPP